MPVSKVIAFEQVLFLWVRQQLVLKRERRPWELQGGLLAVGGRRSRVGEGDGAAELLSCEEHAFLSERGLDRDRHG